MRVRSPGRLTYRLDLLNLLDMLDLRMAVFHFSHRQKMHFEIGSKLTINVSKLIIKEDCHPRGWRRFRHGFSPF